jgi:DNA-binding transcriptional regulator LsrR (DeoR family)
VEPEVVQPPKELKIVIRLRERHAAAHERWQQGMSKAAIGRKLGLHQATVRKLVNARSADDVVAQEPPTSACRRPVRWLLAPALE